MRGSYVSLIGSHMVLARDRWRHLFPMIIKTMSRALESLTALSSSSFSITRCCSHWTIPHSLCDWLNEWLHLTWSRMKRGKGEVAPSERCCDCMKKANKECAYKRCRSCCVAAMRRLGYHCVPHMKDTDRRPAKNRLFFSVAIRIVVCFDMRSLCFLVCKQMMIRRAPIQLFYHLLRKAWRLAKVVIQRFRLCIRRCLGRLLHTQWVCFSFTLCVLFEFHRLFFHVSFFHM